MRRWCLDTLWEEGEEANEWKKRKMEMVFRNLEREGVVVVNCLITLHCQCIALHHTAHPTFTPHSLHTHSTLTLSTLHTPLKKKYPASPENRTQTFLSCAALWRNTPCRWEERRIRMTPCTILLLSARLTGRLWGAEWRDRREVEWSECKEWVKGVKEVKVERR